MRYWTSRAYLGLAWLFLAALFLQFFFAGAYIFGAEDLTPHETLGHILEAAALILLVLSLLWRPGWDTVGMTAAVLVLTVLQNPLAEATPDHPWIAALHPVNALVIVGLIYMLAQRARALSAGVQRPA